MKPTVLTVMAAALAGLPMAAWAQGEMQQKFALVREGVERHQAALRTYTWQQQTQIFLRGELKSQQDFSVVMGPDGKPQKTRLGPPPAPPQGRPLRRAIIERKTEDMKQYMQQAQQLIEQYVPPSGPRMQAAFASGQAAVSAAGPRMIRITFTDYVQAGDSMVLVFNEDAGRLATLSVNSYLGEEKDAVNLAVTFSSLPDGTSHVASTDLFARAKGIEVRSVNANYQKM